MSLYRLVYYSALVGGWAAFFGWLITELTLRGEGAVAGWTQVLLTAALVGAAIGAGLNLVAGMANAQWKQLARRLLAGLATGAAGGALGGVLGDFLYASVGTPRALGWMIMGIGIGVGQGLFERSSRTLRNGLIGGALGGLIGGLLFDPILALIASSTGMSSRAIAFVILGLCIGGFIGVIQVVLKEAWLTVLDGYRPGRQLILGQDITILGTGEWVALPLLGSGSRELEAEHLKILRLPNGRFVAEDNQTRTGTIVNGARITGRVELQDGDTIKLGSNLIRFSLRGGREAAAAATPIPTPTPPPSRPSRVEAPIPPAPRPTLRPEPAASPSTPTPPPQPAVAPKCPHRDDLIAKGLHYCVICDRPI